MCLIAPAFSTRRYANLFFASEADAEQERRQRRGTSSSTFAEDSLDSARPPASSGSLLGASYASASSADEDEVPRAPHTRAGSSLNTVASASSSAPQLSVAGVRAVTPPPIIPSASAGNSRYGSYRRSNETDSHGRAVSEGLTAHSQVHLVGAGQRTKPVRKGSPSLLRKRAASAQSDSSPPPPQTRRTPTHSAPSPLRRPTISHPAAEELSALEAQTSLGAVSYHSSASDVRRGMNTDVRPPRGGGTVVQL